MAVFVIVKIICYPHLPDCESKISVWQILTQMIKVGILVDLF